MIKKILSLYFFVVVFLVMFGVFLVRAPEARAADLYFFTVDSEINEALIYGTTGATVTWKCNGSGLGIVKDGTASESTNALDGIIKIASLSVENDSSHAGCDAGETIEASVSLNGWITEQMDGTVSAIGPSTTFTLFASADYTIVVNGIRDELGTVITLNGTTGSASYSTTVASSGYDGGKWYMAASASGGTIKGGADGYVNSTSSAVTVSAVASQSVDFDDSQTSSIDGTPLSFGHKIAVSVTNRFGSSQTNRVNVTVTAGDSYGVSCTAGSGTVAGQYYCPVTLAATGVLARGVLSGYTDGQCTYTDRTLGSNAQNTCSLSVTESPIGGGSSSGSSSSGAQFTTPTPTPRISPTPAPCTASSAPADCRTPSPTPVPASTVTPTPQTTFVPTPTPVASNCPLAVEIIKKANDPKVYYYKRGFLQWITSIEEFARCNLSWSSLKIVSDSKFRELQNDAGVVPQLIRKSGESEVYHLENGVYVHIQSADIFTAMGLKWSDILTVSPEEFIQYKVEKAVEKTTPKPKINSVRINPDLSLNVRSTASAKGKLLGKLSSGQIINVVSKEDAWYKILFKGVTAFIHSAYVTPQK